MDTPDSSQPPPEKPKSFYQSPWFWVIVAFLAFFIWDQMIPSYKLYMKRLETEQHPQQK